MTMVRKPRKLHRVVESAVRLNGVTVWSGWLTFVALGLIHAANLFAQSALPNTVHYRHHLTDMPPGAIGQQQLTRGGPLPGYFQPVEIRAPQGTRISVAVGGQFQAPEPERLAAGMLIGQVYRLRVTGIPANEGFEVFPTIEVIGRLYPPEGKKWRFPIPIELSRKELIYALNGKYVTRVIYVEDPARALPLPELDDGFQRYFEVAGDQDPLQVADQLGRPVAILRMGSRTPPVSGPDLHFLFGCPPLVQAPTPIGPTPAEADPGAAGGEPITPRAVEEAVPGPQAWLPNLRNAMAPPEANGR